MAMTIGRAAREAGLGVDTLRYYERRGLLPRPARTAGGYRLYGSEAVRRLRFIRRAQELGFTLREIARLLELADGRAGGCREVCSFAEGKARELAARIRDLTRMKKILDALVRKCPDTGPASACTILECFSKNIPDKRTPRSQSRTHAKENIP
jgi:Hg(II)-responsive transcriptional regulator